jgi:CDP-4-dehydro-6-deoxyglucose reductase, E1
MILLIKSTFYREKETKRKLIKFIHSAKILSLSEKCIQFENEFAKWQGRKDCILVNNGSSANLAIIQAMLNLNRINKGDKIGFSAVTWSTNVMPLIQLGLTPVPIDVAIDTLNINPENLLNTIKKHHIKMLFLTNLLGLSDDISKIKEICHKHKIILIEDNCEALGTVVNGKKLGNFGLASTFSFYVGHHLSTIEGGMVATDDEELGTMLRLVRAHGWDRNLSFSKQEAIRKKFKVNSTFYARYTFYDLGYNFRSTEINAYLGLIQLKYLDKIISKRQQNFMYLAKKIFLDTDRFYPLKYSHLDIFSNFAVPVICRNSFIRDELVKRCDGKIEIRPVVGGDMTEQPFFGKYKFNKMDNCPNAKLIHSQGLYFGNNPDMTKKELNQIVNIFTK